MKLLGLAVLVCAMGAMGQVTLSPPPAATDVLVFLQTMEISPQLKAALGPMLSAGLSTRRVSSQFALPFLRQLSALPASQAEEALRVIHQALDRGFIVDPLMTDVLKVLQMGQPWEAVAFNLTVRFNLLVASQQVLVQNGVIGIGPQAPGGELLPQDWFLLETAWAVADWVLGQPREPLEAYVRGRFVNLKMVPSRLDAQMIEPFLAMLTPEVLQQIASRAYGQ